MITCHKQETLPHQDQSTEATLGAWLALIIAGRSEVSSSIKGAIDRAHKSGSARALAPAYDMHGLSWLYQGYLADADTDLDQAKRAIEAAQITIGRAFNAASRAQLFMEQGRLQDAEQAIEWAGVKNQDDLGTIFLVTAARARLVRLHRRYEDAIRVALLAGQRFASHGAGQCPGILPWRSEIAPSLLSLGRPDEGLDYAVQEIELARRWGASHAIGHALRIAGMTEKGDRRLSMLAEAVAVLQESPARLEHAKALIELGSALRRAGHLKAARASLRQGVDLAQVCSCIPAVQQGMNELKIIGGHTRSPSGFGFNSLTPSELRVAQYAAAGGTNREISQELFVSIKTVEVHLANVYRKLGTTRRQQIKSKLGDSLDPQPQN